MSNKRALIKRKILILGGARSGKSTYAQQLANQIGKNVLFIATGQPLDKEMKKRIASHKRNRPANWCTLEIPSDIISNLTIPQNIDTIVLDCVTLLVSNVLLKFKNPQKAEREVKKETAGIVQLIKKIKANFIIVSNEVGLGIVPENTIARLYRDLLGKVNQRLAQNVSEVYLITAGITQKIK